MLSDPANMTTACAIRPVVTAVLYALSVAEASSRGLSSPSNFQQELYHAQVGNSGVQGTPMAVIAEALASAGALPAELHPWVGLHNNLTQLAEVQNYGNSITFTLMSSMGYLGLLKNWLYAITTYGRVRNIIIACSHAHALDHCIQLGLPCYNLTQLAGEYPLAAPLEPTIELQQEQGERWGTQKFNAVSFQRLVMAHALLRLGYNLLQSDLDVVFIKDAYKALDTAVNTRAADGVFMQEGPLNSGVWYVRNTPEIRNLVATWLNVTPSEVAMNDQARLIELHRAAYDVCDNRTSCDVIRKAGLAPIYAHPGPMRRNFCAYTPFDDQPCDARRLYLHAVCIKGVSNKVTYFSKLGLWFVQDSTVTLKYRDTIDRQAPFLPCKTRKVTWATRNM